MDQNSVQISEMKDYSQSQQTPREEVQADETPMGQFPRDQGAKLLGSAFQQYQVSQNNQIEQIVTKYLNKHELNDIEFQQLSELDQLVLKQLETKTKKKKRSDEIHKMFYRKAFKHARNYYFKSVKKTPTRKSRNMSNFYRHYFGHLATQYKVPLTNFYSPDRKTKPGLAIGQKSFSSSYISMILLSDSFKEVCRKYHGVFLTEINRERKLKVSNFARRLSIFAEEHKHNSLDIVAYLQSSKCKIPWDQNNINEALQIAAQELWDKKQNMNSEEVNR